VQVLNCILNSILFLGFFFRNIKKKHHDLGNYDVGFTDNLHECYVIVMGKRASGIGTKWKKKVDVIKKRYHFIKFKKKNCTIFLSVIRKPVSYEGTILRNLSCTTYPSKHLFPTTFATVGSSISTYSSCIIIPKFKLQIWMKNHFRMYRHKKKKENITFLTLLL